MELFKAHPVLIVIAVIGVVIGLVFYLNWKRRKDLEEFAASLGLAFYPAGPEISELENTGLEIFRLGHSRKAVNLVQVQGRVGLIRVFDYHYVTGGGKSSHTHNFTLALLDCGGCPVPAFELKPESFIYKIGEAIGFKDIDLPAFPLFSDKYRLTAPEETSVHLFFTPRRAAWFERHQGLRVQGAPGYMVISRSDAHLPVNSWRDFIEEVKIFSAEVLE